MSQVATTSAWRLPIAGGRVMLRPLRADDLDAFHGYRSDPEVGRYQGWSPMTRQEAAAFIASMASVSGPGRGEWIQLAIASRDTDVLLGDVGVPPRRGGTRWGEGGPCATCPGLSGACGRSRLRAA